MNDESGIYAKFGQNRSDDPTFKEKIAFVKIDDKISNLFDKTTFTFQGGALPPHARFYGRGNGITITFQKDSGDSKICSFDGLRVPTLEVVIF